MSDQDFFFDEDEDTTAERAKPSSKSVGKTTPARSSAPKTAPATSAVSAPSGDKQVSITVAALMTVIGLLVGVIIGFVLPGGGTSATTSTGTPAVNQSTPSAPQLSEDQLNSGEMPAGHPPVDGMGDSSGTSETAPTDQ